MLAIDTSSWIAYFQDQEGPDLASVDWALQQGLAVLPPIVLAELLSDPELPKKMGQLFLDMPLLQIQEGFWERAGRLRSEILGMNKKVCLADSLIAQCCIDHHIPLITRDRDFRHFAACSDLQLV